jgi:hypothetical protein
LFNECLEVRFFLVVPECSGLELIQLRFREIRFSNSVSKCVDSYQRNANMTEEQCPYCREDIKSGATICKHCRSTLKTSREVALAAAISEGLRAGVGIGVESKPISDCEALCVAKFSGHKVAMSECLDNCKAISMVRMVAEKLQRDLASALAEHVWGGGDIDPLPLERSVRDRFARGPRV